MTSGNRIDTFSVQKTVLKIAPVNISVGIGISAAAVHLVIDPVPFIAVAVAPFHRPASGAPTQPESAFVAVAITEIIAGNAADLPPAKNPAQAVTINGPDIRPVAVGQPLFNLSPVTITVQKCQHPIAVRGAILEFAFVAFPVRKFQAAAALLAIPGKCFSQVDSLRPHPIIAQPAIAVILRPHAVRQFVLPVAAVAGAIAPNVGSLTGFAIAANATVRLQGAHPVPESAVFIVFIPPFSQKAVAPLKQFEDQTALMIGIFPAPDQFIGAFVNIAADGSLVAFPFKIRHYRFPAHRHLHCSVIGIPFSGEVAGFDRPFSECFIRTYPNPVAPGAGVAVPPVTGKGIAIGPQAEHQPPLFPVKRPASGQHIPIGAGQAADGAFAVAGSIYAGHRRAFYRQGQFTQ